MQKQLTLIPLGNCPVEIGRDLWRLQDARQRLLRSLEAIAPECLDWIPPHAHMNSIGTVLYHLAAIELDWLYSDVLQQAWTAEVQTLFPYDVRDEAGKLTVVTGISLAEHLQRLQTVRQWLLNAYQTMSLEDFRRVRVLPDYEVTPEWVLHHLGQHESEHRGEMMVTAALQGR